MASARVVAQAKINLFLRILAREASGFHQIETLFCRLAIGDEVRVRLTEHGRTLDCAGSAMPPAGLGPIEKNLAWRAATAFADAAGWSSGFAIEVEKRIPVGGGLGGGSADAGAVLRAMNALTPKPLSRDVLLTLASQLGADVPFVTQDSSPLALAWGRGDRMLTLPALSPRDLLLISFPRGVSTPAAYGWLVESPAAVSPPLAMDTSILGDWPSVISMGHNEFERVVVPHHDEIGRVLSELRGSDRMSLVDLALMSGSGSTVFAILRRSPNRDDESFATFRFAASEPARPWAYTGEATTADATAIMTRTASHVESVVVDE